ncbi:cyanoexosortase C [Leptolyngbya sp. GB1-A1]|uniref:cyanoexosortase C n=1 Tax=Leptolyngbya sp. GB1-A1 TaxID=2933908 RepID=UPI0032996824
MKGKTAQIAAGWFQKSISTTHHRMVTLGLLVVAYCLPLWLADMAVKVLQGSSAVLSGIALGLGLFRFWQQRQELTTLEPSEGDRWLGYFLIGLSPWLLPLGFANPWISQVIWMQTLVGIALSSWGTTVFRRYPLPIFLIVIGLFPEPTLVAKTIWKTFTPPEMLERIMAWSGTVGLRAIGQPASQPNAVSIALPGGTVMVDWGCSGFNMATVMAVASLVVGVAMRESPTKIALITAIGVILALLANIPRIMLLAMSEAYWGKSVFEFLHGFWGGQIFSGTMFTIYYYVIMAIHNGKFSRRLAK